MKLEPLLTEERWNARQVAFHLQQLLADSGFETRIEADVRDRINGYSVWFAPETAIHVPTNMFNGLAICKDKTGYTGESAASVEEAVAYINATYPEYKTS